MAMTELKPCPFCGGSAELLSDVACIDWWVCCEDCENNCRSDQEKSEAVAAWNRRASGWIKVSERLPEVGEVVLLFTDLGGMDTGYRDDVCFLNPGGWYWDQEDNAIGVTHWMPLPEPPND
jgi:Lar family restriction alleviation protein